MGADTASEVYKYLREEEIEQISLEIAKIERMSPEDLKEVIDDFYGLCITQKVIAEGGVAYAQDSAWQIRAPRRKTGRPILRMPAFRCLFRMRTLQPRSRSGWLKLSRRVF